MTKVAEDGEDPGPCGRMAGSKRLDDCQRFLQPSLALGIGVMIPSVHRQSEEGPALLPGVVRLLRQSMSFAQGRASAPPCPRQQPPASQGRSAREPEPRALRPR